MLPLAERTYFVFVVVKSEISKTLDHLDPSEKASSARLFVVFDCSRLGPLRLSSTEG